MEPYADADNRRVRTGRSVPRPRLKLPSDDGRDGRAARGAFDALRTAFSYFSVLPAGFADVPSAASLAYLPLVGIVTGIAAGAAGYVASLFAPHPIAVALAFAAALWLTGAIHVDGFLDASDALFASVSPERRLSIMKDPRHGTYAVVAFVALSAVWLAAIWSLPAAFYPGAFAFAAGLGRWAMTLNAFFFGYAREGGFRETVGSKPSLSSAAGWGAVFAVTGFFLSPLLVVFVPAAAAAAYGLGRWAQARLGGGLTGDVYGFGITLIEVAALAGVATVQASTWAPRI